MSGTAEVSMALAGFFVASVAGLHVRRRDVSPRVQGLSHYAVGATQVVMTAAFVALALAVGLDALLLWQAPAATARSGGGVVLLALAAIGLGVVAAVPVPAPGSASWRGPAHTAGALGFFVGAAAGAVLVSGPLVDLRGAVAGALAGAVFLFVLAMGGVPGLFSIRGLLQRLCFALVVAWVFLVGSGVVAG
jgi:uncharacterized protein DUF998